jgi:hypothetical protein
MDEPRDLLPPKVRRFAPWTWSRMELVGWGLTLATTCTGGWLVFSYLFGWP